MCSLSSCNLSKPAKELMFYLPDAVRPKLLSQLITERVAVDTPCELDLDCPFYSQYYTRLHSDKFRKVSHKILEIQRCSFGESGRQMLNSLMNMLLRYWLRLAGVISKSDESRRVGQCIHLTPTDNI